MSNKQKRAVKVGIFILWDLIIWSIIVAIFFMTGVKMSDILIYPEEEYRLLEKEADRILLEKNLLDDDFTSEFEVNITSYNLKSKKLDFKIKSSSGSNTYITVENYNYSTDSHGTISRNSTNVEFYLSRIFVAIILSALMYIEGYAGVLMFSNPIINAIEKRKDKSEKRKKEKDKKQKEKNKK